MNDHKGYLSSNISRLMSSVALASALGVAGCSDSDPALGANGGSAGAPSSTGGSPASGGGSATGGDSADGGKTADAGAPATNGGASTGGVSAGGASAGGAAPSNGGSSGGTDASTGGTNANGGNPTTGAGGAPQLESVCSDDNGDEVPYDYSIGLLTEYAFELSMNCSVGGYIMPLVAADPDQLSEVNAFVAEATDWYRAQILKCKADHSKLGADVFGLLPTSQTADLSKGDFDASESLFFAVLARHDGQPDGVSAKNKDHIKGRINSIKAKAVHRDTDTLTKTLSEPDCVPTPP